MQRHEHIHKLVQLDLIIVTATVRSTLATLPHVTTHDTSWQQQFQATPPTHAPRKSIEQVHSRVLFDVCDLSNLGQCEAQGRLRGGTEESYTRACSLRPTCRRGCSQHIARTTRQPRNKLVHTQELIVVRVGFPVATSSTKEGARVQFTLTHMGTSDKSIPWGTYAKQESVVDWAASRGLCSNALRNAANVGSADANATVKTAKR